MPKLRQVPFETAIIERYRRRESSVEEALVEMYLAGVSVRRVEDITEALWGSRVSPSTISGLNQKIFERVEVWRNRPLEKDYPYVFVDGIWLKRSWGGEVQAVSVLVAIGVGVDGYREVLGVAEGSREDSESWRIFLSHLKSRGLASIKLLVSDKSLGLLEALGEFYPQARWQRCVVHFYRNVFTATPRGKVKDVALMLKAIHAQEDREAARRKAAEVVLKLRELRLAKAAGLVESGVEETLSYYGFQPTHWRHIRTNNPLERLNREIRRRTRVVGSFPDGHAALMLVAARLRYMSGQKWGLQRYLNMEQEGDD
jgi:transposase-like protein